MKGTKWCAAMAALGVSGAMALSALTVQASGFAIIEQGVKGLGNAYAGGAALAEDASTLFFNPAGLTRLQGTHLEIATHIIVPTADFSNSDSRTNPAVGGAPLSGPGDDGGKTALVPNLYYARDMGKGMKFGLGINAPYGLTTEYDAGWVGRYHATKSQLQTININPSIALKVNDNFSAGFGISAQYADAYLQNAIDFGTVCLGTVGVATCSGLGLLPQLADGDVIVKGDDWGYGFNFGFLLESGNKTRIGLAYRSKINQKLEGSANFTLPAAFSGLLAAAGSPLFVDTGIAAEVDLPETLALSFSHQLNNKLALMADWTWTRWSRFEELRVQFDNPFQADSVQPQQWDDSNRFAIALNFSGNNKWIYRTGIAYDQSPVPNPTLRTPRIPDNDRTWLTFGASYQSKKVGVDFAFAHLFINDADIAAVDSATGHILSGAYAADINILSIQFNWQFN